MKIGVIGLGLIGGSIFKKLESLNKYELIGISRSVKGTNISQDYEILKTCDIVFVCTPMSVTLDELDKLDNIVGENTIVADVCSLKGFVSQKKHPYCFIPTHPMAGTEKSGWSNSFPDLFIGAKWAITPICDDFKEKQKILETVICAMGAEIIITTAEEHDKAVALISHMPLVIAQALCENIKGNQLAQELASSGFKDTTRLALSNTQMAEDMVMMNGENIKQAIQSLNNHVFDLLQSGYKNKADEIKEFRKNLYS
ncbi:MAG: prephenate dehydrogenase/arogenate dehydrogenase family protein [bacterium]|nr:prephenate dehydrogenase/arogenate dehydrogenase family protein [bacterium]